MLFICYPKCSTCGKARKWLEEQGISYEMRDIKEERPSSDELRNWHIGSGLPVKRFVNTSGTLYRELGLKDKLPDMTDEEVYELLSTDGMLVKRPILVNGEKAVPGFREEEWRRLIG